MTNVCAESNAFREAQVKSERLRIRIVAAVSVPGCTRVDLLSAGHGPLFVYFLGEDRFEEIGAQGLPLGISSQSDPPMLLELNKGDLLVLAPDGFFEWTNEEGEQFGVKRVEETIRKSKEKRPNELISTLHAAVLTFSGGTKQQDDLTAVAIKRTQIMLYSALMIQVTSSSRPLTLRLKYRLPTRTDSRLSNSSVDASFL